ncbi:MAG TPA: hydrogenase expression protein HypE [Solirubrobacteraceae bacterium]|nr:hydrogenase expression protein HypE [Solirubrobacteraceae bacterium]
MAYERPPRETKSAPWSHGPPGGQGRGDEAVGTMHVFWLAGMSCDGCTTALLTASQPSVEDLVTGRIPVLPQVVLHHPGLTADPGADFVTPYRQAVEGTLGDPYVIVVEGSIPDDQALERAGQYAALGVGADWPRSLPPARANDQSLRVTDWIWALAPGAEAAIAIGTCATWGGIPAAAGNITNSMSLMDYLGHDYQSARGVPVVNVPGCAPIGDNFTETLSHVLQHLAGLTPLPDFDDLGRPVWQFGETVHRHCPKAGYYEEGVFAHQPGDNQCLVEIGCWGPVVQCNIVERGAINHTGGCMVAGGACIGCTMPGFPDKYSPFYKAPPGSFLSGSMSKIYGGGIRRLRRMSMKNGNREPLWDSTQQVYSGWGLAQGKQDPLDKVNAYFYKKLQYRGSVHHGERNKKQPSPASRDILRQKGVDMEASVPVLGERVKSREEI